MALFINDLKSYYLLTIISSSVGPYPTHWCCWEPPVWGPSLWNASLVCQSWSVRANGVISACLGCPRWKLACWHIFLWCLTEEACDYEATVSCHWLWGQKWASPSTEGLAGLVKVKGVHIYSSHLPKCATYDLISVSGISLVCQT